MHNNAYSGANVKNQLLIEYFFSCVNTVSIRSNIISKCDSFKRIYSAYTVSCQISYMY